MPDDPSQNFGEQELSTFVDPNGIPITIRATVRAWRIHFEQGINSDEVEGDIVRVLCNLLQTNNADTVWPTYEEVLDRWLNT